MPRPRKPWFRKQTGWWMVAVDGRQEELAQGRDQKAEAECQYHLLMAEIAANPPVDGGDPTVAVIIDAYLDHAHRRRPTHLHQRKLPPAVRRRLRIPPGQGMPALPPHLMARCPPEREVRLDVRDGAEDHATAVQSGR